MLRHCIIHSRLINRSINQSINQLKRPSRCFSVNSNPSSTGQSTNQSTNLPGHQSPNRPINQASIDRTNQSTNQSTNRLAIALVVGASIIGFGIYQSKVHAQKDQSINQPPAETLNKPASTTPSIIGSTNQSTNQSTDQSKDVSFRVPGLDVLHAAVSLLLTNPSTPPPPIHEFPPSTNQSTDLPQLKYPVVLVHGFLGYSSLLTNPLSQRPMFEYFGEVRQMFEDAGYTVLVPILPKSYKIEHRAKALQVALGLVDAVVDTTSTSWDGSQVTQRVTPVQPGDQRDVVEAKEGAKKSPQPTDQSTESSSIHVLSNSKIDLTTYKGPFHLISHSMGGVDGRYLISHLQPDDETENRILSLTTIGSPHRGSPIADLIVEQVQKNRNLPVFQYSNGIISTPSSSASNQDNEDAIKLEHIVALIEKVFNIEFKGMLDLTTNAAKEFNKQTLDRPGTRYYSYAGWRKFDPWSVWFVPSKVIDAKEGYNDGLVSVHSARWGDFKGVVGMDHLEQVGLGVFHDHLPLFKEIAGTLAEVERQHGAEQDNLTAMREKKGKKSARESADLDRKEKRAGERQERQRHEEEERVRK